MPIYRVPVRLEFVGGGGPGYNVFHVRTVSNARDELTSALDALEAFYTSLRPYYVSSTRIHIGEAMIRDPLGSPEYVNDDSRVVSGTGAAGMEVHLLSIVCSWRTSSATKSGKGRTFLGPFGANVADNNDGTPTTAALNAIRAAAQQLVDSSTGLNDWAIGVLSQKQGLLRDITGVTVNDRWSYLSSRRD